MCIIKKPILFPLAVATELLESAVAAVLKDPGFKIPSAIAANALKCAKLFLEWSELPENNSLFIEFAVGVVNALEESFPTWMQPLRFRVEEKMWGHFHEIRSSSSFRERWVVVLGSIQDCNTRPIFYEFVTDHIFRQLIKRHFPVEASSIQPLSQELTYEEKSGLRYAAGYVCRAMRNNFAPTDSNIALCVNELTDDDDGQGFSDCSSEWTKLVGRGGLVHVKDIQPSDDSFGILLLGLRCSGSIVSQDYKKNVRVAVNTYVPIFRGHI